VTLTIEDNEDLYWKLYDDRGEIESSIGTEIIWDEPEETQSGKMRSHIWIKREAELKNRDNWGEYFDWLLESGEKFHETFPDRLREYA
jgi:hypothetical protein